MQTPNIHASNSAEEIKVVIEITMNGDPVKYEVDKDTNSLMVDRFMQTAMRYPCNYGYIPSTLGEDGDPIDVLVLSHYGIIPGASIKCRPVGVLLMEDESGIDAKIIAVPVNKVDVTFSSINSIDDVDPMLKNRIVHFFEHYKDLEPSKWVKITGWGDTEKAHLIIAAGVEKYPV